MCVMLVRRDTMLMFVVVTFLLTRFDQPLLCHAKFAKDGEQMKCLVEHVFSE